MSKISRRKFIKLAGSSAALGSVHMLGGNAALSDTAATSVNLEKFDHVVVLMLENRSFDNLLGYLYEDGVPKGQAFEGVSGKSLSNPIPVDAEDANRKVVPVSKGDLMDNPNPDPGEEYPHVNTQLFGSVSPLENRYKRALEMSAPFNAPESDSLIPSMNGFVADYINNFRLWEKRSPKYDEYKVILECFSPKSVPVLSTLAKEFAVFDHWHCAVPSQTFCNRAFFHAGTSSGMVINSPYVSWVSGNQSETIFNRMQSKGISWRVYFDREDAFSLTCLIHQPVLKQYFRSNFYLMEQFYEDVSSGNLPHYSFIEPRLFINHNDMHPPIAVAHKSLTSSVLAGELLVSEIYNAIRLSKNPRGSNFQNTLLLITFDEHGGCYDHVPPPSAIPPDPNGTSGQMGFRFDRLGVRVPAIVVSAYTDRATVVNQPMHHNSLVKTLSNKWNLGSLTARDQSSTDISATLNRTSLRDIDDWPTLTPRKMPARMEKAERQDLPLNGLQKDILGLANVVAGGEGESLKEMETVFQAIEFMKKNLAKRN